MCTDTHALTFEGPGEWDGSVTYAKRFLLQRVIYYVIADYNTQHLVVDSTRHVCMAVVLKTQGALCTHLSRYHAAEESPEVIAAFKCSACTAFCPTQKDY